MHTKNKGKISSILQAITIIPLLFFGLIIMLLAYHQFNTTMHKEVETFLADISHNVETIIDVAYPGDYRLVGDSSYYLYKGKSNITNDYTLIDKVKADTGFEISLFYQDTRVLTTIHNSSGSRLIGSAAPDIVIEEVLHTGEAHFYTNVLINGEKYFSYYAPLYNSDGSIVGMLFVGTPSHSVNISIQKSLYPLMFVVILVMVVIAACLFFYTRNFASALLKIHTFLADISTGNLNAELDTTILRRNDEFGDIGRSALSMQRSLRHMIEQDTLTELFNRRSAHRKLGQILMKSHSQNAPFTLAIGDIDFFKRVNDTYGHECGDIVLKQVADILREHMRPCGFASRWGGEEFLLVFDRMNVDAAHESLSKLLNKLRNLEINYNDTIIKVTMTFGMVAGSPDANIQQLLKAADDKLYQGKNAGRNQIVL